MAERFSEGDAVQIHDGGERREGKVLRAEADSYFVDTATGPVWCGNEHVFAPGEAPESLGPAPAPEPPLAVEANDAGDAGEAAEAGDDDAPGAPAPSDKRKAPKPKAPRTKKG